MHSDLQIYLLSFLCSQPFCTFKTVTAIQNGLIKWQANQETKSLLRVVAMAEEIIFLNERVQLLRVMHNFCHSFKSGEFCIKIETRKMLASKITRKYIWLSWDRLWQLLSLGMLGALGKERNRNCIYFVTWFASHWYSWYSHFFSFSDRRACRHRSAPGLSTHHGQPVQSGWLFSQSPQCQGSRRDQKQQWKGHTLTQEVSRQYLVFPSTFRCYVHILVTSYALILGVITNVIWYVLFFFLSWQIPASQTWSKEGLEQVPPSLWTHQAVEEREQELQGKETEPDIRWSGIRYFQQDGRGRSLKLKWQWLTAS